MSKFKILMFVDRMRTGGIQILLVNLLETFDRDKYQIDVLLLDDGTKYPLEDKLTELKANVFKLEKTWLNTPTDYIRYNTNIKNFFKKHHDYNVVHLHSSSKNYLVLKFAKKYNIPIRIAHSHNTGFQSHNPFKVILGNLLKNRLIKYSTDLLACSNIAGEWLFGRRLVDAGKVTVIKNGVDLERYKYNPSIRMNIRTNLEISDKLVIGNVGRFVAQKNHSFLLDIFFEIKRIEPKSVLLLAGIGELMDSAKEKARMLGIEKDVKFLGFRTDVNEITQAMDLFLMPSLYEGFPVTAIEAQAAGLPCVLSSSITKEAAILDDTIYIDLNQPAKYWAERSVEIAKSSNREDSFYILKRKGFDIADMALTLEEIYCRKADVI